jgi:hypothetical protein
MSPRFVLAAIVWTIAILFGLVIAVRVMRRKGPRRRRPRSGPGPGAMGAVYGMLQEDKRKAIEIIVEGRAEQTNPEHADGTPKAGRRS